MRITSAIRYAYTALAMAGVLLVACKPPALSEGIYGCTPGVPNTCPHAWHCVEDPISGEARCFRDEDHGLCGNGSLEGAEECDDGNVIAGDGCSPACIDESEMELDCDNGLDDDSDGLTDCDDPDCFAQPGCTATTETSCTDGVDNDGDLLIDCDDSDCEGRQCGANSQVCQLGICVCSTGQSSEVLCADGVDDDCDGLVDCIDPDCASAPECAGIENICDDGLDNDSDGSTDCFDSDCAGAPCGPAGQICSAGTCACPGGGNETLCTDGQDNDCDGSVDCADSDCALNPGCVSAETDCDDSIDNDSDGSTDCFDSDCTGQPCDAAGRICSGGTCACPGGSSETLCTDGQDNDCDGSVDCADSDCSGISCGSFGLICSGGGCNCPGGTIEVCSNSIDDNCNGQTDENCGSSTCTLPLNPSAECGAGYQCAPQPGVGSQGLCSGPTGAGSQSSQCVDNTSCGSTYECVDDGTDLLCLQWCTSWLDCPDPINSDCYPLPTPVYINSQEWGVCNTF